MRIDYIYNLSQCEVDVPLFLGEIELIGFIAIAREVPVQQEQSRYVLVQQAQSRYVHFHRAWSQ